MRYLLDTVTIVRHFTGKGKIGRAAASILGHVEQNEHIFAISIVSLMEIMYLAEKNQIELDLAQTLNLIGASAKYMIVDLTVDILRVAETIDFAELHDRLILATAKWLGIKLLSSDGKFNSVVGVETVWG